MQDESTLNQIFLAGCGSGLINSFIVCPTELAKIQLQNQIDSKSKNAFKGPLDFLVKLYKTSGFKGFNRGFVPTLIRETPGSGVYFLTFEYFCRKFKELNQGDLSNFHLACSGGLSGVASWISTYPFDVIKTRIQDQKLDKPLVYKGTLDCAKQLIRNEGFKSLFKGLGTTVIRAFPTNAVIFATYSYSLNFFERNKVMSS